MNEPSSPSPESDSTASATVDALPEVVVKDRMTGATAARAFLALICSHAVAPYATARFTIRLLLDGTPEFLFGGAAAVAIIVGALLAFRQFAGQPRDRRVLYFSTIVILWYVMAVVQLSIAVDSTISRPVLALLWGSGTIWVAWFVWAWSFFRGAMIATGTVVVVAAAIVFWTLIDITGLTGDAAVEVAWRKRATPVIGSETRPTSAAAVLGEVTWSGYLGSHRTGIIEGLSVTSDWLTHEPQELWRVNCGAGWSSFAATETTLFTQEQIDGHDCVTARSRNGGELIWLTPEAGDGFVSGLGGDGPRSTPTLAKCDDDDQDTISIFAIGPSGLLRRLDGTTGREVWAVDTLSEFKGENLVHGVCGSPLVVDGRVIVCPPSEHGPCLAAFDVASGSFVWKSDSDWRASYASPDLMTIHGRPQVVVHAAKGVIAVDPTNGKTIWEHPWTNEWDNNATQPITIPDAPDELLLATGYRGGAVRLRFDPSATPWQPEVVWETRRTMRTKFCNMAVFESVLVGLDNGILCGVDIDTGKQLWKKGRYGHGQMLQAGNLLLIVSEKGKLHMLRPNAKSNNEQASVVALDRKTWNHPIVVGQEIVIRNDQEIVCFELPSGEKQNVSENQLETPEAD